MTENNKMVVPEASFNRAVGVGAGSGLTTGSFNTCVGRNAGANITTGNFNLCIGDDVQVPDPAGNHQIVIGYFLDLGEIHKILQHHNAMKKEAADAESKEKAGADV